MNLSRHLAHYSIQIGLGLCFFCLLGLVSPQLLYAAPKQVRIAILPRPGKGLSQDTSAWLHRFLQWAIRRNRRILVLQDKDVQKALTERALPRSFPIRLRVCRRYIKKAKQLYNARQIPLARRSKYVLKALGVAQKMFMHIKSNLEDPTIVRDLLLYRALAYSGLGQQLKTRAAMLKLVQFAPNLELSGQGFPSGFVRYHETIKRWLKGQNRYTMKIDSVPSNAKIYHNYRYLGRTPYSLTDLVPGTHFIRIRAPGFKVWERPARLSPKKLGSRRVITVKIPLQRDPEALSIDSVPIFAQDAAISDDIMDKLKAIIKRLKIKHLYIVEPRRTAGGDVLRFATFQMHYTRIRYRVVPIGRSHSSYRRKIMAFAHLLGQSIAPAPIVRRPKPRPVRRPRFVPKVREQRPVPIAPIRRPLPIRPLPIRPLPVRPRVRKRLRIPPKRRPPQVNEGTPFYGTWWFWTATVAGAGLVAGGVFLVMKLTEPPPSATLIITTQSGN